MENRPSSSSKFKLKKSSQIDIETQKDSSDTIYLYNNLFRSGYISEMYVSINNEKYLTRIQRLVRRVYCRLTYLKLRRCIMRISSNLTIDVLRSISPKLYGFFKDRVLKAQFRLRLLGENWPPLIIYQTTSKKLKTISIYSSRECKDTKFKSNSSWSFLFSDEPLVILKQPKISNSMMEAVLYNQPFRSTHRPRSKVCTRNPKHREILKYTWKSQDQKQQEKRTDFKYRSPTSLTGYTKGQNFHSLTYKLPKLTVKVSEDDKRRSEYRDYWYKLGTGEIIYTRTNVS